MKTNPANSSFAVIRRRIAKAGVFFIASVMAYVAYTDYVGTLTNRIFIEPASVPVVANGYQNGDVISYIAESTPDAGTGSINGAGAWNTLFVPPGVVVVGAEIVQPNGDGTYSAIPAPQVAPIKDGCGNRGCAYPTSGNIQNGKLNEGQQDSGIFYSTNSRTQLLSAPLTLDPTGSGNQEAWNLWDAEQVRAFGGKAQLTAGGPINGAISDNGGQGNTPVVDASLAGGTNPLTWAGTGSPVAGPQTYFTNDYNPICTDGIDDNVFEDVDLVCNGPWNRISYMGSTIGGSGAVTPTTVDGVIPNVNTSVSTSSGFVLPNPAPENEAAPYTSLPGNPNAVRYVMGRRTVGELETVRITFQITNASLFTASLTDNSFCYDATGGDNDKDGVTGRGSQDNIWRYYQGNNHFCFQGSADATAFKSVITVDGVSSSGSADADSIIGYDLQFTNTGNVDLFDINISDVVTTPGDLALIAEGNPLCHASSYDGDYSGSNPAFISNTATTASWAELPLLPAGQTVTVKLCAQVDGGANFGTSLKNRMDVTFALVDGGATTMLSSETQIVVSTIISGKVILDPDSSGHPTNTGDTGISGVVVNLYEDLGTIGVRDAADIFLESTTTNSLGNYSFIGNPDGDRYLIEETGLTDLLNTGDKDTVICTGGTSAATSCDIISFTLAGSSISNNFYNVGASIGDFVWNDLNGDGVQDGGTETGIDGVTLDLYQDVNGDGMIDAGDILLKTTTTASGGAYDFIELSPGDYLVDVTDTGSVLGGSVNTTSNDPLAITVTKGQDYNDADFGYQVVANLFISKDDSSATYTPGGSGTYIIVVGNYGPSNVTGATVSDTLPLGVTLSGPVTCVATGSASCSTPIGDTPDSSFTDSTVNITADPTGTVNFVTYSVPVNYSLVPADYTP